MFAVSTLNDLTKSRKKYRFLSTFVLQYATFIITEEGLKIIIEDSKSTQIVIYLPTNLFLSFVANKPTDGTVKFSISLKVLTECLNIFGDENNSSLKLSYKADGYPLVIM